MYPNNINLSLTFLGFFLITNVFGAPGASGLAKNQTSTTNSEKVDIPRSFSAHLPQLRKDMNKILTENDNIALGYNVPLGDPRFGELKILLC